MKVTRVDIFPLSVPLKGVFKNAHAVRTSQESIVLIVQTDEGFTGLGNVDPDPGYSEESFSDTLGAIRQLAPDLTGMDPLNITAALERMDRLLAGRLDAKAAIEMALFDLKGKVLGVPVHALLGGAVKEEIFLNAWIGMLPPEQAAAEACAWHQRGFRSAKIKVGSGIEQDYARVKSVREAVGNRMALRIDANEAYSADEAIRLGKALAPLDLFLFEQPVSRRDLDGMAKVRRAIEIPVMADEAILGPGTLIELIKKEAADIIKVKVMKQGGIQRTTQMIHTAEAAGIRCVIGHGFGLAINTLAELHVAASCRNVLDGCEFVGPLKMETDVVKECLRMDDGRIRVPLENGLGAEIDHVRLRESALASI
ncbi:MAG: hypothetical protein HY695_31810 [Deltaproteobacteria bacterium]|nr:hypothetical protein [Deltaproteobacteria bacterium]